MKYLDQFSTLSHSVYALYTEKVAFVTFLIVFSANFEIPRVKMKYHVDKNLST